MPEILAIGNVLVWKDPRDGTRNLASITDADFGDGDSGETIYDTSGEAIGTKQSRASADISLTQRVTATNEEKPNWLGLKQDGALCRLTRSTLLADKTIGVRTHFDVVVTNVTEKANNTGDKERSITLTIQETNVQ